MKKGEAENPTRKRARELYIESYGQSSYEDIRTQLLAEGHKAEISTLRQWRKRDIAGELVHPEKLLEAFKKVGDKAHQVAKSLQLPGTLSPAQRLDAARIADLENAHERMLAVVNAGADRLIQAIPDLEITSLKRADQLSLIMNRTAEAAIKLRLALVQVAELRKQLIGAHDSEGRSIDAEIIPPPAPDRIEGLGDAVNKFKAGIGRGR